MFTITRSPRLNMIINMCQKTHVIADVGTDHGYACVGVLQRGMSEKAIATDISEKSLEKAKQLFMAMDMGRDTECRVGDGLSVLKVGEAGGIILSGMGAPLIISILQRNIDVARSADYLVLSPHTYPERLRSFLGPSGFSIQVEEIAEEGGKYYIIMKVSAGTERPYSFAELLLGRHICPSPVRLKYLKYKVFQYRHIAECAKGTVQEEKTAMWLRIYETALEELEG